jgi:DNA-binding GntR family transcriptional regulator
VTHPSELPWKRALAALRGRIDAGEWDHGERLPTIRELGQQLGVSHGTVARALRVLADEGLVIITPSYGTFRA